MKNIQWEFAQAEYNNIIQCASNAFTSDRDSLVFWAELDDKGRTQNCGIGLSGASEEGLCINNICLNQDAFEKFNDPMKARDALAKVMYDWGLIEIE